MLNFSLGKTARVPTKGATKRRTMEFFGRRPAWTWVRVVLVSGHSKVGQRPDFEMLLGCDRRSFRRYLMLAIVTASLGLTGVLVGWLGTMDTSLQALVAKLMGLAVGATTTLPIKECFTRWERMDGIRVLQERWSQLAAGETNPSPELLHVQELYRKLLERAVMGGQA